MEKDKKNMMKKEGKSKKKGLLRNVVIFFLAFGLITSLIPIGKMLAATSDPGNLSVSSYNSSVFVEPEYKTILQEDDHSFVIKWNVANTNDLANKYDLTFYTPGEFFFESDSLLKNLTPEQMVMAKSSTYDYKTIKHVINVERVVAGKTDLVYKHNMYIFNTNTNAWDININDCFQVTSDGNTGLYVYDINASNGRGFYSNKTSLDKVFNDTYRQAGDRYIYKLGSQVFAVRWISGVGTDYCEIFVTNLAGMSQSTIYDFELAINNAAHTVEKKSFLGRISLDITPERYYVDKNSYNGTDRTFKISNIDYTSGDFDFRDANCRVASKLEFEAIRAFNASTQKFDYVGIQKETSGPDTGYYTISGYDTIKLDIVIQGNNPGKGWDVDLPKLQNLFIDYKSGQSNADDNDLQDNDSNDSNGNPKQKDRCVLLQKDSTGKWKYVFHLINWDYDVTGYPLFTAASGSSDNLIGEKFILLNGLKESFCYKVNPSVSVSKRDTSATLAFKPFYTFINYTVKKQSINETYVYLTPYGVPGKYEVYVFNIAGSGSKILFDKSHCEVTQTVDRTTLQNIDYNAGDKIYIPINVSSSSDGEDRTYDIGIKFYPDEDKIDENGIESEVLKYNANADKNITIDVPTIIRTDNLSILTDKHEGEPDFGLVRTAQFRITWNITEGIFGANGKNALLNNSYERLWYEVKINTRMRDYGDAASTSRDEKYQTFDIVFVERLNKTDVDFPNHGGDILVWSQSLGRKKGYRFTQAQILDNPSIWCDVSLHPLDRRWVNQIVRVWDIDKTKSDVDAGIFYPLKNGNPFRTNEFTLENDKVDYTVHSASEAGTENGIAWTSNPLVYKYLKGNERNGVDADGNPYAQNSFFRLDTTSRSNFNYPLNKNYFISMQGYYYSGPTLNTVTETDHGVPVNIVLTETSEIVPIPDKLTISDVTNNSFEVLIDKVDPTSYAQKMLNPIDTYVIGKENGAASELKNEAKYEIVIAQNQNLVNDILNGVKPIKTSKENKIIYLYGNNNSNFFTYDGNTEDIQKAIDVNVEPSHQITNNNNVTQTSLEALDKVCIDYLRLGYAIVFRTEARHLKLNGLDNNQMYYIGARTALHVEDQSTKYHNQSNAIYDITSTLSKIYYQITGSDIVNPTDDERIPATPENFELYNVEDKSITVRWLTPLFREEEGIDYGFELVRVEGSELSDTDNDSKRKMIEIASGDYSEFGGYRLFTKDKDTTQKLEKWNKTSDEYKTDIISNWTTDTVNHYYLTDNDVNPNTIYYYYVRSIKRMSTGSILHSEWTKIAATTVPISGIGKISEVSNNTIMKNLYGINDFNQYYERVIAFEGPVGQGLVPGKKGTCKLPDDIGFDISKKLTTETEYVSCKTNDYKTSVDYTLEAISEVKEDSALYIYRLHNLESGSKYDVRVAVVDLSREITPYPMSRYCDPIQLRTEFNQDDYDKKEKYEIYDDYYRSQLEDLTNELYYVLTDDKNAFSIKFKEDRFQGELGSTRETTYLLPVKDKATSFTYYLSAYNIKELNRLRKGLKFIYDGVEIVIPYNFINEEYTKIYGNMIKECDDVNSGIEDFYLKLWIGLYDDTNYVNSYKVTSPRVQVAMKLIELSAINADIDYEMDNIIRTAVAKDEDKFMEELEIELNGKINDAGFAEFVKDKKAELIDQLQKVVTSKISNYELDGYTLSDLYSQMQVRFRTSDQSSRIFTRPNLGKWVNTATTNSGVYAQAYMKTLGSAVNTSGADLAEKYGQESTSNAYLARTKYNLDPVFIRYGKLNSDTDTISKDLFIDVAFAICQIDSDDVFELANQKKKLTSMFKFYNTNLTRQEIVYGVMQLYNEFSNININNVVINNTLTSKNYNIKDYYKQSIYAGMQLGLINEKDISNPNEVMTVNKMFDLIYKVLN